MSLLILEKSTCDLTQIWGQLKNESQNDVIHLLAMLAFKQILAQLEKKQQEVGDEQNSS